MNKSLAALSFLAVAGALPAAASEDYYGVLSVRPHAHLLSPFDVTARYAPKFSAGAVPSTDLSEMRIGYKYSQLFKVEAGFAKSSLDARAGGLLPANGRSISVDAVGTLPIWSSLAVLGRAGYRRVTAENDPALLVPNGNAQILNQAKLGLGLQYQFSRSLGFRAEVERYRNIGVDRMLADNEGDSVSLGVSWRF